MMSSFFIKTAVRSMLVTTSRQRAINQAARMLEAYLQLAEGLSPEAGCLAVEVPPMRGVDEDMRRWSFFMIIEHNTIVNRSISATILQLVKGEPLSGAAAIDPKKDVMPVPSAGKEQLQAFKESVDDHVAMIEGLGPLRGTHTSPHPIFGNFDAHMWNGMFSFHLGLHYKQARHVVGIANPKTHESRDSP